jgi:hypothetical protein
MLTSGTRTLFVITISWNGFEYYLGSNYAYVPSFYFYCLLEEAPIFYTPESAQYLIDIWERCTTNRTAKIRKVRSKLKLENGEVA